MKAILTHFTISLIFLPRIAIAAFASGETVDAIADWMAIFVIVVVPLALVAILLILHILPEKIAEKNNHPQKTAIQVLCLLSLVFGGLLWPLAWLWAFTKPVGYRMAYGTDRHDDYFKEAAAKARHGELPADERATVLAELDGIAATRRLTPELQRVRDELLASPAHAPASAHDNKGPA